MVCCTTKRKGGLLDEPEFTKEMIMDYNEEGAGRTHHFVSLLRVLQDGVGISIIMMIIMMPMTIIIIIILFITIMELYTSCFLKHNFVYIFRVLEDGGRYEYNNDDDNDHNHHHRHHHRTIYNVLSSSDFVFFNNLMRCLLHSRQTNYKI